MSIQKKNGKYYAAVYQGIVNGKQSYEWSDAFDSKEDAQLKELEMKKDVIETNHTVRKKESFVLIAESWLASRKNEVAATTYRQNLYYYETYINPYFKSYLINKIEPIDVRNYMNQLNLAPATINKAMNIMKLILDYAILCKYIRYNPCMDIKKPKIKISKSQTWSQTQIKDFLRLEDVKQATGYIAFCILFTTGMRPGEVCGLRWCDWHGDFFMPTIGIDTKRENTDLKNEFAHQKVFISTKLQDSLKWHKKVQKELCLSHGVRFSETNYINALEPDMRPMTPAYLRKSMQRILEKHDMGKLSPYAARHSFGTNMMRNDINPKKVSEAMRHSTVRTTLDRYSHVDDEMKKNTFQDYADDVM